MLGGSGTRNTTATNWWNNASDVAWSDTSGTVTLATNLGALGLVFNTTAYTIALGGYTLLLGRSGIDASSLTGGPTTISGAGGVSVTGAQSWAVGSGSTLAVSGVISGAGFGITKSGVGR